MILDVWDLGYGVVGFDIGVLRLVFFVGLEFGVWGLRIVH